MSETILTGSGQRGPKGAPLTPIRYYPVVVCADGTQLSVQASRYHYCAPRADRGPYTHVEVRLLPAAAEVSGSPAGWEPFRSPAHFGPLFQCLPAELAEDYIARHGGSPDQRPSRARDSAAPSGA